jgi:hypothetical protein
MDYSIELLNGIVYFEDDTVSTDWPTSGDVMEPSPTLRFTIDYPLTNPCKVELVHEDASPWTERQFVDAVMAAYREVYASEKDPGRMGGLLNRGKSDGPYGIWGHDLGNLALEGAYKVEDGSWRLSIGS